MNHPYLSGVTLACLACLVPSVTEAQVYGPPMGMPMQAHCTITRPRPVVSTHLQAQQVTTFRDVTETQVCAKQVVESVPITTCKNVTVDEGGYQMVWVPKPVTKQVAQTVMQQQVKTVSVPVQVVRRVPQISTQMVPVQSVQYVNETVPIQATAFASSCETCGGGAPMSAQMFTPQISAMAPYPTQAYQSQAYTTQAYSSAMIPTMPAITVPAYQTASGPMIPASRASVPMAPVPNSYEETVPARGVPQPRDEEVSTPRKTSMFTGVPSAAAAWQRQNSYAR